MAQPYIRIPDSKLSPPTAPHLLFDGDAIDPAHVGSHLEQLSGHVRLYLLSAKGTRRNSDSGVPDLLCDHRNNKLRG